VKIAGRTVRPAAAFFLVCANARALAHHSVTATYDTSKIIMLDGDVRQLELGFPHSHLLVEVRGAHGAVTWKTELASVVFLRRAGWTSKSLSVGEHVHLTGSPSRYSATELYVLSVTKADGTHLALLPLSAGDGR